MACASVYGFTRSESDAERLAQAGMAGLMWGFGIQVALMLVLVLLGHPRDADAQIQTQRTQDTLRDDITWVVHQFGELLDLRHSVKAKDKTRAMCTIALIWTFAASIGLFIAIISTIAGCPNC